jgi:hypothetical protein
VAWIVSCTLPDSGKIPSRNDDCKNSPLFAVRLCNYIKQSLERNLMKTRIESMFLAVLLLSPVAALAQLSASYYLQQAQINQAQGEKYQQMASGPQGQSYAAAAQTYFNAAAEDRAKAAQLSSSGGSSGFVPSGGFTSGGNNTSQAINSIANAAETIFSIMEKNDQEDQQQAQDVAQKTQAQQEAQATALAFQQAQQLQQEDQQFGSLATLAGSATIGSSPSQSEDGLASLLNDSNASLPASTPSNLSLDTLIVNSRPSATGGATSQPDLSMDSLLDAISPNDVPAEIDYPSGRIVMSDGTILMPGDPSYPKQSEIDFPGDASQATPTRTSPAASGGQPALSDTSMDNLLNGASPATGVLAEIDHPDNGAAPVTTIPDGSVVQSSANSSSGGGEMDSLGNTPATVQTGITTTPTGENPAQQADASSTPGDNAVSYPNRTPTTDQSETGIPSLGETSPPQGVSPISASASANNSQVETGSSPAFSQNSGTPAAGLGGAPATPLGSPTIQNSVSVDPSPSTPNLSVLSTLQLRDSTVNGSLIQRPVISAPGTLSAVYASTQGGEKLKEFVAGNAVDAAENYVLDSSSGIVPDDVRFQADTLRLFDPLNIPDFTVRWVAPPTNFFTWPDSP